MLNYLDLLQVSLLLSEPAVTVVAIMKAAHGVNRPPITGSVASQERGRFGHPIDIEIKFQKYSKTPFLESLRLDMKSVSQY